MMIHVRNGAVFVRDNTTGLYYMADVLSLWLMDRKRCYRDHNGFPKGKWILDLRNFKQSDNLGSLFNFLSQYMNIAENLVNRDASLHRQDLFGEVLVEAGTPRTNEQKEYDVSATR